MTGEAAAYQLDEAQADFITHHVSILVGSCNVEREPSIARAYGCRVAPDRRAITVFLSTPQSAALLQDLRIGSAVAVVFSRPTTHQTLQLKGTKARILPLADGDRTVMRRYGESLCEEIGLLGFRVPFTSALMAVVEDDAVAMVFTPTSAFDQTPGPAAGQPLPRET